MVECAQTIAPAGRRQPDEADNHREASGVIVRASVSPSHTPLLTAARVATDWALALMVRREGWWTSAMAEREAEPNGCDGPKTETAGQFLRALIETSNQDSIIKTNSLADN